MKQIEIQVIILIMILCNFMVDLLIQVCIIINKYLTIKTLNFKFNKIQIQMKVY